MKYIITFLSAFLFFQFSAQAQAFKCGTDQSDAFMEDLIRNKKNWDNTMQKAQVERFVPVQFHLIANNDGSGRVDPRTVLKSLCELNENYDSLELRFYLADEMNEINNTQINNNPGGNASASAMRNAKNNAAMNVFVIDDSGEGVAGFYTQGGDYIVVNQNQLLLDRHTTEHEVGHFFTLAHTHRGWEDQPYDPAIHGDTVLVTTVNSSQSPTIGVELVDGSNCGNLGWNNPLAGDGICDTPPDYGFGQRCNCCNMGWTVYDRNGDLIEPMLNNVMSYSENCSPWNFTPQQVLAVKTSYDSDRRAYLRVNEVSDYTPLTEGSVIVSPMNLETIDSYNGVLLEWESVPNAEEYIITVDGTVANEYRTSNT
ncbi:MAG: hypothetical protein HKN67_06885, partial [Saprospiraceae bacterium]|nr:hypothetical protein [Saprospiraceae bacterium]